MFKSIKEFFFGKPTEAQKVEEAPYKVEVPAPVTEAPAAPVANTQQPKKQGNKKPAGKKPAGKKPNAPRKPKAPKSN